MTNMYSYFVFVCLVGIAAATNDPFWIVCAANGCGWLQ